MGRLLMPHYAPFPRDLINSHTLMYISSKQILKILRRVAININLLTQVNHCGWSITLESGYYFEYVCWGADVYVKKLHLWINANSLAKICDALVFFLFILRIAQVHKKRIESSALMSSRSRKKDLGRRIHFACSMHAKCSKAHHIPQYSHFRFEANFLSGSRYISRTIQYINLLCSFEQPFGELSFFRCVARRRAIFWIQSRSLSLPSRA